MNLGSLYFEKAFALLGQSTTENIALTKSEFARTFPAAFAALQSTVTALDFLYFRPSFWDEVPVADDFAKRAYVLMTQGSSQEFEASFTTQSLLLRKKLLALLHKKPARAFYNFAAPPVEPAGAMHSSAPSGDASVELSGVSMQQVFGTDFQMGHDHNLQSLHDLMDPFGDDISHVIEKLEQHGYTQMTQLRGLNADKLMNTCHFDFAELKALAETMSANGIFFTYSWPLFRQFTPRERTMLSHPKHRVFQWNPTTNRYFNRAKVNKLPKIKTP